MAAPALQVVIQGLGSVSADNLNTFEQTCDTIAQLRGLVGIQGVQVFVRGITAPNDGGAGEFYWSATAVGPDDGVNVIVPTGAARGAWIRLTVDTLVALGPLITTTGQTILQSWVYVPIDNITGTVLSINLPASPVNGETHTVKDWLGNAATYAITINGNGNLIDGQSSYTLASNGQAANFMFAYGKWGVW